MVLTWPLSCSYLMHPALADACIHLAAVPMAGEDIAVTRIPVAAGCIVFPAVGTHHSGSWATSESMAVLAGQPALNAMRCRGTSGHTGYHVEHMLAKAVGGGAERPRGASDLTYSIVWQASARSPAPGDAALAASATGFTMEFSGNTIVHARSTDMSAPSTAAAATLAILQQVRAAALGLGLTGGSWRACCEVSLY